MFLIRKLCFTLGFVLCAVSAWSATPTVVDGNYIMDQPMAENLCALTFDDGPSRNTPHLLDMLASYEIPATFFLLGSNARLYPEMVSRIAAEGHEIGNHSWSHPNLRLLTTERQTHEIQETDELLKSMGVFPIYMRPPYGSFDDRTIKLADELGISLILWSLDSRDWKSLPADYGKVPSTRGTIYEPGSLRGIFLFHDTHKSTVEDLPRIIANLKAGGCDRFVTVSDYLKGVRDQEPAVLMTRRTPVKDEPEQAMYSAGSGPVPFARCSRPWQLARDADEFEAAHAAAAHGQGGL